jgi:hypothetical protein
VGLVILTGLLFYIDNEKSHTKMVAPRADFSTHSTVFSTGKKRKRVHKFIHFGRFRGKIGTFSTALWKTTVDYRTGKNTRASVKSTRRKRGF